MIKAIWSTRGIEQWLGEKGILHPSGNTLLVKTGCLADLLTSGFLPPNVEDNGERQFMAVSVLHMLLDNWNIYVIIVTQ